MFGGVNGLNIFDPEQIQPIAVQAQPLLIKIGINDNITTDLVCSTTSATNVPYIKSLVLPYSKRTVSFYFSAMEYSNPGANIFQYKLENYDKDFVFNGANNFARYPNLPFGRYTFLVRATNSDGVWSDQVATIAIQIRPPWYLRWWALTLFGLLLLGILYAVYRDQIARIKRKEAFRRKELDYKRQVAEIETAVLRLQMNPHFIFNSMNSIRNYILQKNIDTADEYLERFARLMRMILKFAENPFIAVSEEMELLEQYLETEQMRFEKPFNYYFHIPDDLDPDEVILPTMILQPFVENAIWHGLSDKEGERRIHIRFWQEQDLFYCSIEDNGIGRAAAAKRRATAKSHESKALSITERRLKLLEAASGKTASYKLIDLYDEAGQPMGTQVLLQLPLL